ncbi:MAG: hypothetical protein JWO58_2493 [Chitinophagaceae bacterium]|nr:hypothetical protein [Chitinophagaceae bacterium]
MKDRIFSTFKAQGPLRETLRGQMSSLRDLCVLCIMCYRDVVPDGTESICGMIFFRFFIQKITQTISYPEYNPLRHQVPCTAPTFLL